MWSTTWCDIVSLNPNVKACPYRELPGACLLTFYIGRKVYQPPDDARQVTYYFRNVDQQQGYLDIILSADAGPYGTKDHRMTFEAVPVAAGRTLAHVSYSYQTGNALRLALKRFISRPSAGTMSWFTVIGTDPDDGSPVYVKGRRGALERNAVRYYCAIQTFIDTQGQPEERRLATRIDQWYELTDRFRKQLFILEKSEYISMKSKEHAAQEALQRQAAAGMPRATE